jgi:hypothetical protein
VYSVPNEPTVRRGNVEDADESTISTVAESENPRAVTVIVALPTPTAWSVNDVPMRRTTAGFEEVHVASEVAIGSYTPSAWIASTENEKVLPTAN